MLKLLAISYNLLFVIFRTQAEFPQEKLYFCLISGDEMRMVSPPFHLLKQYTYIFPNASVDSICSLR